MESTILLINLLGAGALLIWGLRQIKSGILSGFGASLRQWIGKGTRTRVHAVISGFFVTISMQSSTATAMIAASFAGRGLIDATMAQAVMLGANLGTAVAATVLSLDLHWLAAALILVGVITLSRSRFAPGKGLGQAILGLGLMLLALRLLGEVTDPLHGSTVLKNILAALGSAPIFALILSALLAVAATSSLAVVLLIALIAQSGMVPLPLVLTLVAGANVGGALPPWLATLGEGIAAQRLTFGNLLVRLAGGLLLMLFSGPIALWLQSLQLPLSFALQAHLLFNMGLLLLFLPLVGPVSWLMTHLLPEKPGPAEEVSYLDESSIATPSLALAGAAREVLRMGDQVREMLEYSLDALQRDMPEVRSRVTRMDDSIDAKLQAVKLYLARLRGVGLDEAEAKRCNEIMSYAINMEHIGDIIDHYLAESASKRMNRKLRFSDEGRMELAQFYQTTLDNLQLAQSVFLTRDIGLARQLMNAKVSVRRQEEESSSQHLARIYAHQPETIDTSTLHLDILRDLKRINAHLASAAYPVLEEIGALRESRLKSPKASPSDQPSRERPA